MTREKRTTHSQSVLAFASAALLATTALAQSGAFFQGLGDLPGGAIASGASGVSGDGSTVVGQSQSTLGGEAYRWTASTGMVGLSDLPGYVGSSFSNPFGSGASSASFDGSVVTGAGDISPPEHEEAFRWTTVPGMVGTVLSPGPISYSIGADITADGSMLIGTVITNGIARASSWTSATGWLIIGAGAPLPGFTYSAATGVSDDGSVIAVRNAMPITGTQDATASYWTAATGLVDMGDLPGGVFNSGTCGVSADGTVIVGFGTSANGPEAFRWTAVTGMVGLGDLPGGAFGSRAAAASADGSVIVGVGNNGALGGGSDAFIWDAAHGMRKLQDVIVNDYGLSLAGFTRLTIANGVSSDGFTIVGTGVNANGASEGWVVHFAPCPADLNADGFVNAADLASLLTQWGSAASADLNGDGVVNGADLENLLTSWGICP